MKDEKADEKNVVQMKLIDVQRSQCFELEPGKTYMLDLGGVQVGQHQLAQFKALLKQNGINKVIIANFKNMRLFEVNPETNIAFASAGQRCTDCPTCKIEEPHSQESPQ